MGASFCYWWGVFHYCGGLEHDCAVFLSRERDDDSLLRAVVLPGPSHSMGGPGNGVTQTGISYYWWMAIRLGDWEIPNHFVPVDGVCSRIHRPVSDSDSWSDGRTSTLVVRVSGAVLDIFKASLSTLQCRVVCMYYKKCAVCGCVRGRVLLCVCGRVCTPLSVSGGGKGGAVLVPVVSFPPLWVHPTFWN